MARRLRIDRGGIVYHVLNRRVGRLPLFEKDEDFAAFEKVLDEAHDRMPIRVLGYCLMPNHWHLLLWPARDDQVSRYMQWLTTTHMRRWHACRGTAGTGPVYQGRFKSFPIQEDGHFLTACRYVERNPVRANLVARAEDWLWSSASRRLRKGVAAPWLVDPQEWPVAPPRNWRTVVNRPETEAELEVLRQSVMRGAPFGEPAWQRRMASRLRLESSLRPRGRPQRGKTGNRNQA